MTVPQHLPFICRGGIDSPRIDVGRSSPEITATETGDGDDVDSPSRRTFYRLARTWPPGERDYTPLYVRKNGVLPLSLRDEERRASHGLSAYDSEDGARRKGMEAPWAGRHIARYDIPEGIGIWWEKTFGPGHWTLYGELHALDLIAYGRRTTTRPCKTDPSGSMQKMAHYDVWDTDTNNMVGHYMNERDALRLVRDLLNTYGDEYASDLQLGGRDNADRIIPPLGGSELIAKVRETVGKRPKRENQRNIG